ncbi:S8 family peptidase [Alkalihalobacillus sp. NPDC078783]
MFRYSMIKFIRKHASKLDKPLRDSILELHHSFRFAPIIVHPFLEQMMKKRQRVSIIIEFEKSNVFLQSFVLEHILDGHRRCHVRNRFSCISSCSADVTLERLEFIVTHFPSVKKVYLNRTVNALMWRFNSTKQRNSQTRLIETGKGINVAIIDTGIFQHEDLKDRIYDFVDFINQKEKAYDDNGHGTHCAGIIAGDGSRSEGLLKGIAPEANVIGVKVLDRTGSGTIETIIQGVDWCMKYNQKNPNRPIHVISLSIGTHATKYRTVKDDPIVKIVDEAWRSGITVITAAGNDGPEPFTISSPGVSEQIITVGAISTDHLTFPDALPADFSSNGPTIYGQPKPDLYAPGLNVTSLRNPESFLNRFQKSVNKNRYYTKMSGTSMATAYCAGAVALLLQSSASLTPDQIKNLLVKGAKSDNRKIRVLDIERSLALLKNRHV